MGFEPQKFFIGLMDFFSILLPGALLTYLMQDELTLLVLGERALSSEQGWLIFLFSSYLLGHFIFLIGSGLLDDYVYDPVRSGTYDQQIGELAKGNPLSPRWARWVARYAFRSGVNRPVAEATRIKIRSLDADAAKAINTFQWCKAKLTLEHPEALATVQRFEADSKFFRSLVVVLCFLVPWSLYNGRIALAQFALVTLALALWRYKDQRLKATNQAYWYLITLAGGKPQTPVQPSADMPTHAGGVVYRKRDKTYLLVKASRPPYDWVLPKGHIEHGQSTRETAVREVREEAGVWASCDVELGTISFTVDGKPVRVAFFLMNALEEGKPREKRERAWLPLDEAIQRTPHEDLQQLLSSSAEHVARREQSERDA
jgi:ADP-ribose pyrophosphatase YjhB (NUDIX family)